MILLIYGYGYFVLKKKGEEIIVDYLNLDGLIKNMWEIMYGVEGVGLVVF